MRNPAPLLGTIAQHYSQESANAELAGWLARHGGWDAGLPLLLDAVRDCPFRTRAAAMLDVLPQAEPGRSAFLRGLRTDRQLGPIVTMMLVEEGELALDELSAAEGLRAMAEQFIQMLEIGGLDATGHALDEMPAGQGGELVSALLESGHPDRIGLGELRQVAEARFGRRPGQATVHPLTGLRRSGRSRSKRAKRR